MLMRPVPNRSALRRWLSHSELPVALSLVGFVAAVRFATLVMLSNSDAALKWGFIRGLLHGEALDPAAFDHHQARWGVNLPVLFAQLAFGDRALVQLVPTVVFEMLLAVVTYVIGKRLGGRWVGALAVALYVPLPAMAYVGSQLMPTVYQSFYCLLALYALLRDGDAPGRGWLYVSAASFIAAYLSYETAVFFLPGLLAALWWQRRKWSHVAAYVGSFVAFVGLEVIVYRLWLGFDWGRYSIIKNHHLRAAKLRAPVQSVADLFERYLELSLGFRELFYAALLASVAVAVLWKLRRFRPSPALLAVLATTWGFLLANTFALRSLNPPRLLQPLNERYLFASAPLLALVVAWGVCTLLSRRVQLARWASRRVIALGLVLVAGCVFAVSFRGWHLHPIAKTLRYEAMLQQAFDAGTPLINKSSKRNVFNVASHVFLTHEQFERRKVVKIKRGRRPISALVDSSQPRFRSRTPATLRGRLKKWSESNHVLLSTPPRGFTARAVKATKPLEDGQ